MRHNIRRRLPKVYVSLFLCFQQRALEKELAKEKFMNKIAPFLAQYDTALDYLQSRRQMYIDGSVPSEDEGLRALIMQIARFAKSVETSQIYSPKKERGKSVKIDKII